MIFLNIEQLVLRCSGFSLVRHFYGFRQNIKQQNLKLFKG